MFYLTCFIIILLWFVRFTLQPLHVKMVEVEDYTALCVARVEIKDERFMLIGVLGSWWIMPFSSAKEISLFDSRSWKEFFSVVKNRFRLAADLSCYWDILSFQFLNSNVILFSVPSFCMSNKSLLLPPGYSPVVQMTVVR